MPQFLIAKSVPFVLQTSVDHELNKVQDMGAISRLAATDHATLVVPVVKKDGEIKLCSDYKTAINPCLETDF